MENTNTTGTLNEALHQFKESWNAKAGDALVTTFVNGIEELKNDAITERALKVGDKAPDFELKNAVDQVVKLSWLLEKNPVVLTWYRGGWCPYCNMQLRYLQAMLPEFKNANATLVAISPETPDNSLTTKEKNKLDFEVLSDFDNRIAKKFGIAFTLNDELVEIYNGFHKLETFNGVATNELPIPATYVIDTDFTIRYAFVNPDYRERAEPSAILKALNSI
jgi:peroxiredoxin